MEDQETKDIDPLKPFEPSPGEKYWLIEGHNRERHHRIGWLEVSPSDLAWIRWAPHKSQASRFRSGYAAWAALAAQSKEWRPGGRIHDKYEVTVTSHVDSQRQIMSDELHALAKLYASTFEKPNGGRDAFEQERNHIANAKEWLRGRLTVEVTKLLLWRAATHNEMLVEPGIDAITSEIVAFVDALMAKAFPESRDV